MAGSPLGPYVSMVLTLPVMYAVGYLAHRLLISRVTGGKTAALEGEGHYAQLILTLGIALVLQHGAMMVFGPDLESIRPPLSSSAWEIGPLGGDFVRGFGTKGPGYASRVPG